MAGVVKPVMIKSEFVSRAIECRLQSVGGNWKYTTIQRTRQTLQYFERTRRETNENVDNLFRISGIFHSTQKNATPLEIDIVPTQA